MLYAGVSVFVRQYIGSWILKVATQVRFQNHRERRYIFFLFLRKLREINKQKHSVVFESEIAYPRSFWLVFTTPISRCQRDHKPLMKRGTFFRVFHQYMDIRSTIIYMHIFWPFFNKKMELSGRGLWIEGGVGVANYRSIPWSECVLPRITFVKQKVLHV